MGFVLFALSDMSLFFSIYTSKKSFPTVPINVYSLDLLVYQGLFNVMLCLSLICERSVGILLQYLSFTVESDDTALLMYHFNEPLRLKKVHPD